MSVFQGASRACAVPQTTPLTDDELSAMNLEELTNAQLVSIADSRGLDVPKKANKAQLIDLIKG